MDSIFIEKGTEDVTDPLRSVDKSLLPVESVEPSKEIFLDGDPEADELIQGSTFYKKGSTFLHKAQVGSHNTGRGSMQQVLLISLEFMGACADSDYSLVNLGVSH